MRSEDAGTAIPLVLLCFLLAGTLVTAGIAASAAFLAQRDLAGICDGAAVAAAAGAVDRTALAGAVPADAIPADAVPADAVPTGAAPAGAAPDGGAGGEATALPLDPAAVAAAVEDYRGRAGRDGLALAATTDGRTVTVTCRRTARIPFGAVLGRPGGLQRTAVARARSPLLPARRGP